MRMEDSTLDGSRTPSPLPLFPSEVSGQGISAKITMSSSSLFPFPPPSSFWLPRPSSPPASPSSSSLPPPHSAPPSQPPPLPPPQSGSPVHCPSHPPPLPPPSETQLYSFSLQYELKWLMGFRGRVPLRVMERSEGFNVFQLASISKRS